MLWGRKPTCSCGTCAKCKHRAYMRRWYRRKSIERRRELRTQRDPERVRAADRARHERMKGDPVYDARRRAVTAVNNAIRDGRMERQPCEVCGDAAQAHHDDYGKPFDVRWLCTIHHAERHMAEAA